MNIGAFSYSPCSQEGISQGVLLPQQVSLFPQRGWRDWMGLPPFIIKPLPPEIILLTLPLHSGQTLTGRSFIDWFISNCLPQASQIYSYDGMFFLSLYSYL